MSNGADFTVFDYSEMYPTEEDIEKCNVIMLLYRLTGKPVVFRNEDNSIQLTIFTSVLSNKPVFIVADNKTGAGYIYDEGYSASSTVFYRALRECTILMDSDT